MTPKMLARLGLEGKVVLLTGGAGIYGRGLANDLAEAGATLVIASRNRDACEAVVEPLRAQGLQAHAEAYDQADPATITALAATMKEKWGRVDGLVNNTVSRPMQGPQGTIAQWEDSMKVNATGVYAMHRAFGDIMADQGSGSIVNIASIQGVVGPTLSLYEGTDMKGPPPDYFFHKAGMINLSRFFAAHLGPRNVRVNALIPGGFQSTEPEVFLKRYWDQTFLRRSAHEDDLGGAVIFLLSDASRYVTGTQLPVDGGYTAH
ncbi:MAG TPA: SDR family oxidoreductase [Terrimicrobiaceae bacterium]|nr:SDR family oxidoreductase [Terrimicrobiaceae bacterium]